MSSSSSATLDAFSFEQLDTSRAPVAPREPMEADALLSAAHAEAERIREDARAQGYEEGRAVAMQAAQSELEPAVHALAEIVAGMNELREQTSEIVERAAVELGLQIAEKALAGALEAEPERVVDVVRGSLRCLLDRERVTVMVNPEDLDIVRASIDEVVRALGGIEHIEVQEERRVCRGGAVVRSTAGEIDGRIETKLERAREVLTAELAR